MDRLVSHMHCFCAQGSEQTLFSLFPEANWLAAEQCMTHAGAVCSAGGWLGRGQHGKVCRATEVHLARLECRAGGPVPVLGEQAHHAPVESRDAGEAASGQLADHCGRYCCLLSVLLNTCSKAHTAGSVALQAMTESEYSVAMPSADVLVVAPVPTACTVGVALLVLRCLRLDV